MNKFPILESERLILDEIKLKDSKVIFEMFSDPEVVEFYDFEVFKNEEEAIKLIESDLQKTKDKKLIRWAIREKSTGELIGGCGLNRFEFHNHVTVISYEFIKNSWGKGYATEAISQMVEFAFSADCPHLVNRVEANTMLGNGSSDNILKKLGFVQEGVLREYGYWKGKYHDLKLFSLLKKDHLQEKKNG